MGDKERILNRLINRGCITPMDAFSEFGCTRLSAYIFTLRKEGYHITTDTVTGKDRFGEPMRYANYKLERYWSSNGTIET